MLTADSLKQIPGLTDDQITSIAILSKNDEDTVVGQALKKVHDAYDNDFKEALGIDKPADQKSYVFWKEQVKAVKAEATKLKTNESEVTRLTAEKANLEKMISEGKGSEAMNDKLAKVEKDLHDQKNVVAGLKASILEKDNEIAKVKSDAEKHTFDMLAEIEFNAALQGVQFNKNIPQGAIDAYVQNAKAAVLATGKREVREVNGKKETIFRDEVGNIIANPKNLQNPFTIKDLFLENIKDVLAEAKVVTGGGGGPSVKPATNVDLSQARTRVEATTIIYKQLAADGFVQGTEEFSQKASEILSTIPQDLPMN